MTMKANGMEPTYLLILAACPKAALSRKTQQPFSKDTVYGILAEDCYDDDPCLPCEHKARYSKKALTDDMKEKRVAFATFVSGSGHNGLCFFSDTSFGRISAARSFL